MKVEFDLNDLQQSLWETITVRDKEGRPLSATPTDVAKNLFLAWLRQNANLDPEPPAQATTEAE